MPILGAMAENASLFVAYSQAQVYLRRHFPVASQQEEGKEEAEASDPLPLPHIAIAGGCAGAVTSFVLTPLELIKVRMQVQMIAQEQAAPLLPLSAPAPATAFTAGRPPLPGPVQLFQSVLRRHGVRGLWLGQTGTFLREAGGSVAWFSAFEAVTRVFIAQRQSSFSSSSSSSPRTPHSHPHPHTTRRISKDDLSSAELMLGGAAAGACYTVVLFPADCIKSTIQTGEVLLPPAEEGNRKQRVNPRFLEVGRQIYRARGVRGLYSGCGVTVVRSAPSSAIIFWLYSLLERRFG